MTDIDKAMADFRPMPADYDPPMETESYPEGDIIASRITVEGVAIHLGFLKEQDSTQMRNALRQSMWQSSELVRLESLAHG